MILGGSVNGIVIPINPYLNKKSRLVKITKKVMAFKNGFILLLSPDF
jgi:hypothetical protein